MRLVRRTLVTALSVWICACTADATTSPNGRRLIPSAALFPKRLPPETPAPPPETPPPAPTPPPETPPPAPPAPPTPPDTTPTPPPPAPPPETPPPAPPAPPAEKLPRTPVPPPETPPPAPPAPPETPPTPPPAPPTPPPAPPTPPPAPEPEALPRQIIRDLSYGNAELQKLDLLLPAGRTNSTPLVVVVHGGGWILGDKSEVSFLADGLQDRGFAVANINYRLAPGSSDNFAMQLDDIGDAIDYALGNSGRYSFNSQKVYLVGHSSGGHIAMGYAYTRNGNGRVRAVSAIASPTNLYELALNNPPPGDWRTILAPVANMPLFPLTDASAARYRSVSPYFLATSAAPATIFFHGDLDWRVPLQQAESLSARLSNIGVSNRLVVVGPGVGHDWWNDAPKVASMIDGLRNWFNTHP